MSKCVREKCGKLCIFSVVSPKRGITPIKIDANWRHSNLICSKVKKKSYAEFQLNMSKHVREKCGKLCISSILNSKRGITPTKIDANGRHSNLISMTVKQSYMQHFSSISQSMLGKKCGKLHICASWKLKRGITPAKIDGNWCHSNLFLRASKESDIQNFSSISQSM